MLAYNVVQVTILHFENPNMDAFLKVRALLKKWVVN